MMDSESETLTHEEFVSLFRVGDTCAVTDPPASIPFEHEVRLTMLGYMADVFRQATPDHNRQGAASSGI
jgi:hypothetical protein